MTTVQVATRIDPEQDRAFRRAARDIGTTPADALRVFISAFVREGGFPFQPRIAPVVEAFDNEADATRFVSALAKKAFREAR